MNQGHISKEEWLSKIDALKISTEKILNLHPDWCASNGWDLKELMIHLQAWDEEYLNILKGQRQGESYILEFSRFSDYKREDQVKFINRWNNQIINEKKHLSVKVVREQFI